MNKYMKIAIDEAKIGIKSRHGGPFGSVIVKNGEIVSRAHNRVLSNRDATCHGEIEAIREASRALGTHDLSGCELYTTAEPCPMCLGAIKWSNIDRVYYGCNVRDTENIGFRDNVFYNEGREGELMSEMDRDACLELFAEYSGIDDKENY